MSDDWTDEEEWTVDGFIAECDAILENPPPAPDGFELVECEATPRHWPTYFAHIDGMYDGHCPQCEVLELDRRLSEVRCQRTHRRWKSWNIWSRIASHLYVLGITSSGGGTRFGRCEFCGIIVQHMAPHWRGHRSYVLGLKREAWTCLRHGHRTAQTYYGMCAICCPCPSCGSTEPDHEGDCGSTA